MDETLVRQFVAATNQMYNSLTVYETDQSLEHRRPPSRWWRFRRPHRHQESNGSLVQCAGTGCSLLRNAVYMQALLDDAWTLNERTPENRKNLQIITAVDHFDFFLGAEGRLLKAAGTDPSLTTAILQQCREARAAARQGQFNAFRFRNALEELREAVCTEYLELRGATSDPGPSGRRYRRLAACFKGVCGCVVVGLDASALAATIGLTAAGSAVSIAVGAAVVDHALGDLKALADLRDVPPPRPPDVPPALA